MRWGFVLLGFAVIAGVIYFYLPKIREFLFRRKLRRLTPAESASAVFRHMRILMHLPESTTVSELAEASHTFWKEQEIFLLLDVLLYGQNSEAENAEGLTESYQKWHEIYTMYLKEQAQKRRQDARNKRKQQKTPQA